MAIYQEKQHSLFDKDKEIVEMTIERESSKMGGGKDNAMKESEKAKEFI